VRENTGATGATDATNHVVEVEDTPAVETVDSDHDSDDDNDTDEVYKLRSGKEVRIGDNDGFKKTRGGRRIIPPDRLAANTAYRQTGFPGENMHAYKCGRDPTQRVRSGKLNQKYLNSLNWDRAINMMKGGTLGAMWAELEQHTDQEHNSIEWMNPALFSVKANSDDNPTWNDAMGGEDGEGYWQACIKEHETLLKRGVWEEVEKESWMNVLPSVWAFKCKRYPDGLVRKLKARFCAMGCCQKENVDYFETFAPVVNWQTVRIMLAMSMLFGLATKQVDYTAAFVHADIDRDPNWDKMTTEERRKSGVFIQGPRGFATPGKVLKLKKSLYGLKQSPRNFYNFLKGKLEFVGFTQSGSDQCLFISEKVVCLVYVDDTLLFAKDMKDIDDIIAALQAAGMELEVEDDVAGFLGVHIDRRDDGTIHLTQKGLIARIIQALNIGDLSSKHTPAEQGCLGSDPEGDPPNSTFSYPSVIGMLQYLQGHSRPDITFAVSQCARWTHNPKRSHEEALQRIGRYLKGTKNLGLILHPAESADFEIDCYVDADFAGTWGFEHPQDPSCVKSRTGFVIFIMGTPVVWTSRLQTDIATSTMESEYNAMSMAMRDVIPLRRLTKDIIQGLGGDDVKMTHVKTTVHEDNHGCLRLGTMEPGRMTPRSKHYGIKYHWFRGKLKPNETEMAPVSSALQRADFLTKSLRRTMFEANRRLTCGW
jgi:histone deacetylase 1/2